VCLAECSLLSSLGRRPEHHENDEQAGRDASRGDGEAQLVATSERANRGISLGSQQLCVLG
jgi:hypothetical protein